nr:hypothetical protein [Tanacetum cinerariifolium]
DPHRKAQKVPAQASKVARDASTPLDVDSDPDIHEFPSAKELKDMTDCHWVVAHVTPLSWNKYLREISIEQLCDNHDKAYMRQAVFDNVLNGRTRELNFALQGNPVILFEKARVISDAAMKLICSDEMGVLIARLGKASIIHDRCAVFEEVVELKKPFILEEMSGYHPSSKEEYGRAGNDLADASYLSWLS